MFQHSKKVVLIDEIFDLLLKNILEKVTDFVPYIDNNVKLFLNKKDINITGIDNDKSKEYIVQNLLTEVTDFSLRHRCLTEIS